MRSERRSHVKNPIRSSSWCTKPTRSVLVGRFGRVSNRLHPSGNAGLDSSDAVFDHDAEFLCGVQEDGRIGFPFLNVVSTENLALSEVLVQTGDFD